SIVWRIDAVPALRADTSPLKLLASYDERWRPVAVEPSAMKVSSAQAMLSRVALETPVRRGEPAPETMLMVPGVVPGGEYELLRDASENAGEARLVVGRLARPSRVWSLRADFHDGRARLELPASVGSLAIVGDRGARGTLSLRPLRILGRDVRLTDAVARR